MLNVVTVRHEFMRFGIALVDAVDLFLFCGEAICLCICLYERLSSIFSFQCPSSCFILQILKILVNYPIAMPTICYFMFILLLLYILYCPCTQGHVFGYPYAYKLLIQRTKELEADREMLLVNTTHGDIRLPNICFN